MRTVLGLLVILSACSTAGRDEPTPPADSVRERLEEPARLLVAATESGGALTAERKVGTGWEAGMVELGIENGELIVSADGRDALTLEGFQVSFKPIDIPDGVFGAREAQLTHVRVDLTGPQRVAATWSGDDEVRLTANLELALSWTLSLDGSPAPLGSPTLPAVPVEIVLTGDGEHVQAELRANAAGELWSWAGLIKLADMTLVLGASL